MPLIAFNLTALNAAVNYQNKTEPKNEKMNKIYHSISRSEQLKLSETQDIEMREKCSVKED